MREVYWYRITEFGTAEPILDSPEVCRAIDAGEITAFISIEGAIKHGGVLATAFERRVEATYDAAAWLRGEGLIYTGDLVTLKITATPPVLR